MKRILMLNLLILGAILTFAGCEDKHKVIDVVGDIPATPTGVYSVTGDRQVEVIWDANNDNGLTAGYGVYRYKQTVNGVDQYELLGKVSANAYRQDDGRDVRYYVFTDYDVVNGQTYYYAVDAYNEFGESDLSYYDAYDTPRPEGSAVATDYHEYPGTAGFDFSRSRVVPYNNSAADIFFEFDPNLSAFFLWAGGDHVDIQDYGSTSSLSAVGWGDPGNGTGWSTVGWLELIVGHSYIIWTADDHYATIRVTSSDSTSNNLTVDFDWAYQTDPGNAELKPALVQRPHHDANYGKRKG